MKQFLVTTIGHDGERKNQLIRADTAAEASAEAFRITGEKVETVRKY